MNTSYCKVALAWIIGAAFALGQGSQLPKYTVATLPSATAYPTYMVQVINGISSTDCTVGGGSFNVICTSHGGVWVNVGGGGGGTTTNSLTGAASGGAAPGSTFNGGTAVTFDYHTFGAEAALGNPGTNGYILSSTTGGTRSWIAPGVGGVTSINSTPGAFTFTGPGVSCTSTTCTFSGSGSGIGSITWSLPSFMSASPTTISATGTQTFSYNSAAMKVYQGLPTTYAPDLIATYSGADFSKLTNNCIITAEYSGQAPWGGTCDASGLTNTSYGVTQTVTEQINSGQPLPITGTVDPSGGTCIETRMQNYTYKNTSTNHWFVCQNGSWVYKAGQNAPLGVKLILPPISSIQVNIPDTQAYALQANHGTYIDTGNADGLQCAAQWSIANSSVSMAGMFAVEDMHLSGTSTLYPYFFVNGLCMDNASGGTLTNGVAYVNGSSDNSYFGHSTFSSSKGEVGKIGNGIGSGMCCASTGDHLEFVGAYTNVGGTPLTIAANASFNCDHCVMNGAGTGKPNVWVQSGSWGVTGYNWYLEDNFLSADISAAVIGNDSDTSIITCSPTGGSSGNNYAIGDRFKVVQSGGSLANCQVDSVTSGHVNTAHVISGGQGYATATGLTATALFGSGTGLTVGVTVAGMTSGYQIGAPIIDIGPNSYINNTLATKQIYQNPNGYNLRSAAAQTQNFQGGNNIFSSYSLGNASNATLSFPVGTNGRLQQVGAGGNNFTPAANDTGHWYQIYSANPGAKTQGIMDIGTAQQENYIVFFSNVPFHTPILSWVNVTTGGSPQIQKIEIANDGLYNVGIWVYVTSGASPSPIAYTFEGKNSLQQQYIVSPTTTSTPYTSLVAIADFTNANLGNFPTFGTTGYFYSAGLAKDMAGNVLGWPTSTIVGISDTQTVSNKTLLFPVVEPGSTFGNCEQVLSTTGTTGGGFYETCTVPYLVNAGQHQVVTVTTCGSGSPCNVVSGKIEIAATVGGGESSTWHAQGLADGTTGVNIYQNDQDLDPITSPTSVEYLTAATVGTGSFSFSIVNTNVAFVAGNLVMHFNGWNQIPINSVSIAATSAGTPARAPWAAYGGTAQSLAGTGVDSAPYQSASGVTSYITAPTTTGHTFVYGWQPSGSAVAPTAVDLTTSINTAPDVTFTTGTTAVSANSCNPTAGGGGTSVTMTGLTSSMALSVTPSTDTSSVTGWGAPAGTVLYITAFPGSGAFHYYVCNNSSASVTPGGSVTWNVSAK